MYQSRARRRAARFALLGWALLIALAIGGRYWTGPEPPIELTDDERDELLRLRRDEQLLLSEIGSLRRQLQLRDDAARLYRGFRPVPARVVPLPDLSPRARSAFVDVGAEDGVRVGHGVLGDAGVVGQVVEVHAHRARVRLADDPEFRVRFHVDQREGIVAGGPTAGFVHPHFMREFVEFEVGDLLLTAGSDGRFPRDVVIGRVVRTVEPYRETRVELQQRWEQTVGVVVLIPPFDEVPR